MGAEIQTTQPSNRFEHRVRGLLPNWTRALRLKFLLGTSGRTLIGDFRQHLERRMISPPQDGVLEPWNIRCCLKYPKGENQGSEMLIFWPDFPGDTKYYPLNGPHLKKGRKRKDRVLCTSHHLITSSHQCILMH